MPSGNSQKSKKKLVIIGAGGRDFHNFLVHWKDQEDVQVVCFTHAEGQIPIEERTFPSSLAGPKYPEGIPIVSENQLEEMIDRYQIDLAELAYSDLSYIEVGNLASRCLSRGCDFMLLSPQKTALPSKKPVIAVCGVRTGVGKSAVSLWVVDLLKRQGLKVGILRHCMPYLSDLEKQTCQRFETEEDLRDCTFEELEEYNQYIEQGDVIWSGIDYKQILEEAEKECDVILFDGGNNDTSLIKPDLKLVVADALRPDSIHHYHPGETNSRDADAFIITKASAAAWEWIIKLRKTIKNLDPGADIIQSSFELTVDGMTESDLSQLRGKKSICVEDGPSLTHGSLKSGAAEAFCQKHDIQIVDPDLFAVGEVSTVLRKYPALRVIPSIGYRQQQIDDLKATLKKAVASQDIDVIFTSTPVDLKQLLKLENDFPIHRVRYQLDMSKRDTQQLEKIINRVVPL